MSVKHVAILFWVLSISLDALATDRFISAGFGTGGASLSDATGGQNYNIKAGSGIYLLGGAILPVSATTPHRFEAQLGIGFIFEQDYSPKESAVSWSRVPVEAIYFYRNTRELFRLGWGAIYHINNKIEANGANASAATSADHAFGWTLAAEKLIKADESNSLAGIGLKYNFIKYHSSSFTKSANGNALFLTMSGLWL